MAKHHVRFSNHSIRIPLVLKIVIILAVVLLVMPGKAFAYPSLSTGVVTVGGKTDECMRRAKATISTSTKGGSVSSTKNVIKYNSTTTNAIIHCTTLPGGKSYAFMAVTADDGSAPPSQFRDVLYDGIQSGGPYE